LSSILGILNPSLTSTLTDRPASFKALLFVTVRDNLQTATGAQGVYPCTHDTTHC